MMVMGTYPVPRQRYEVLMMTVKSNGHAKPPAFPYMRRGSRVETIFPDRDSQNALGVGMNLMDLSTRRRSAQAGYNQGKALAEQLTEFWR
jgi:hypothetical protein